ncbi:hypothetical protein [Frankia sp. Cas3]|uniref:hypothetical protein n=1 Tax=Frankia sp. Cas3 TaxID=3073926 RepID=UPI002AD433A7|nr:hypothetical protein [Frankia sp. Cas3]
MDVVALVEIVDEPGMRWLPPLALYGECDVVPAAVAGPADRMLIDCRIRRGSRC